MRTSCPDAVHAKELAKSGRNYHKPSVARGSVELVATVAPFFALWGAAGVAFSMGYWWVSLLTAGPAAIFLVRLFLIQHDCGHGAFFPGRSANDWAGRILGVVTLTPYDVWRRTHAVHHATSGNLDQRGIGDINTLTVGEYFVRSRLGRLQYRLYRHPLVMFGLGPVYLFLLRNRLPLGLMRSGLKPWVSAMSTNGAIALVGLFVVWQLGVPAFVTVHVPIILLASSIGVWLFYVQHQFEETSWSESSAWRQPDAALHGSSYYDLPGVLRWLTANVGIHHVHHLSCRIPYYRLPQVLTDHPRLADVGRVSLLESLGYARLALWDPASHRLVSFRQARVIHEFGGVTHRSCPDG